MRKYIKKVFNLAQRIFLFMQPDIFYNRNYIDYNSLGRQPRSFEAQKEILHKGLGVLDKLGIQYSIGRGTLLGIYRDGKFVEGDMDIDIDVFKDDDVFRIIKEMPFELLLVTECNGKYQQIAFYDKKTDMVFDIWFYNLEKGNYINRNFKGNFILPKEKVENLSRISYGGIEYLSLEPEWFCLYWYGKNWRTPVHYNEPWYKYYRKECSAFSYKRNPIVNHFQYYK